MSFWVDCVVLLLSNLFLKTIWVLNLFVPEVHISLSLLGALQSGADAGAGLWNCGKGGMRAEVNERESARQAGQEGAQDISSGRVKKLQGWRSDQTGLRRPQGRPWGKFTGTPIYFKNVSICRWLLRIFCRGQLRCVWHNLAGVSHLSDSNLLNVVGIKFVRFLLLQRKQVNSGCAPCAKAGKVHFCAA